LGSSHERGREGEEIACRLLKKKGYSIIRRNFRSCYGELDLIALKGKTVAFVEVKTRKENSLTPPLEALTRKQVERIKKSAQLFLQEFEGDFEEVRFDLITVELREDGTFKARHLENAY